jgi:calcium-dependent protein kinase
MTVTSNRRHSLASRRGSIFLEKFSKQADYKKKYEYISMLGNGGFGKVRLYRDKLSKELKFAIKTLKKDFLNPHSLKSLEEEVSILRTLDHPNIVKYFETYEDDFYIHIVMEYIPGDNLFKVITNRKYNQFSEKDASEILCFLFKAILFLHKNKIVHRDIKPENILFSMPGKYESLKVIDFGLSVTTTKGKDKYRVGSPYYMAPEMLEGSYTFETDVWSIGVILYVMMTGVQPFLGRNQDEVFAHITRGVYDVKLLDKQKCSEEVKDLIKKLLVLDPKHRLSLESALEHPWLIQHRDCDKDLKSTFDDGILDSIRSFANNNPLQKEILFYLAKISNESEIIKLKQAFLQIDTDNTGTIEFEEVVEVFNKLGIKPEKVRKVNFFDFVFFRDNFYFIIFLHTHIP